MDLLDVAQGDLFENPLEMYGLHGVDISCHGVIGFLLADHPNGLSHHRQWITNGKQRSSPSCWLMLVDDYKGLYYPILQVYGDYT